MPTTNAAGVIRHVVLELGQEEYALPLEQVREIVRWSAPTPLPDQPAHVEGTVKLRDEVVTVVDLAVALGRPSSAADAVTRDIVVVELPDRQATGLTVDGVQEVLVSDPGAHHPSPEGIGCGDHVDGIISVDDRLVVKLSMPALLAALD